MILTQQEINNILEIIDRYTILFISHNVGTSILSDYDKYILKKNGIDISSIKPVGSKVYEAYRFGMLSQILSKTAINNMSYTQLKDAINKLTPLTTIERNVLESLKLQTYHDVSKLSSRMKGDVVDTFVKVDKKNHTIQHTKLVTDAAKKAIEKRKFTSEVVSILGEKTGNWDRDLRRISDYVLHTAFDEGRLSQIEKNNPSRLVYKDVYSGACDHCKRLYLTGGIGSEPRLFTIAELKSNGNNVGRKVQEWLPVVGSLHPFCRCTIEEVPKGFTIEDKNIGIWYWDGTMFVKDFDKEKSLRKRKVERKSKVKVTVNGKTTEI